MQAVDNLMPGYSEKCVYSGISVKRCEHLHNMFRDYRLLELQLK